MVEKLQPILRMQGNVALGLLTFYALRRLVLHPLYAIRQGTMTIAQGNLDHRLDVRTGDELGELAGDFNRMADTLEKYEGMRKQWLTDVSHELRTPLSILRGEIEGMLDGVRKVTPENLELLRSEILRMGRIVDDLHALSMAESGTLHFKGEVGQQEKTVSGFSFNAVSLPLTIN